MGGGEACNIPRNTRNKESRPFFLGDTSSIGSCPSVFFFAIAAVGGPECYFSLAIIAFGAFQFVVPKCNDRSGRMDMRSPDSLINGC